jgi:leucyl aminopeptidase
MAKPLLGVACLAILLGPLPCSASASLPPAALPEAPVAVPDVPDPVWLTIGVEAFDVAERMFSAVPGGRPPRLAEADGVVQTVVSRAVLAALGDRIREELGHRSGFVAHASRAAAETRMAKLAARALPRAPDVLPFTIDEPEWVANLQAGVTRARILATITALSTNTPNRRESSPNGISAANWIRAQWEAIAAGHPGVTVAPVTHVSTQQPSIVLTIPGTTLAGEYVILGGHEDSTAFGCGGDPNCLAPGADDNASGIATVTEVLRVALAHGFVPQRTVQFMAYAAEEVGLFGSDEIAASYAAQSRNVVAVLNLDMTGYHGSTEDVFLISDLTHSELNTFVGTLLDTYQPGLTRSSDSCGYPCSDHASWSAQGYRASFPFEASFGGASPWIHSSSDTVPNLQPSDASHAVKFARLAVAFLVETSLDGVDVIFLDPFELGNLDAWDDVVFGP